MSTCAVVLSRNTTKPIWRTDKLSGVDDFRVERCTVERWGRGGSAVDMVGCHRGVIDGCTFRDREQGAASNGVQTKGGTRDVVIRRSRFEHAGERAVNLGGSTGLAYFRPNPEGFEARDITVEGCTFIGSITPIAFVGVDGANVRFNTFYRPRKWFLRILQETLDDGFAPCRNGTFTDNLVAYRASEVATPINVGPGTAPETFVFTRNYWFCIDAPARPAPAPRRRNETTCPFRRPSPSVAALRLLGNHRGCLRRRALPRTAIARPNEQLVSFHLLTVAESSSAGGADPLFHDAENGDLGLPVTSPARAYGAQALPVERAR